ncbi:MULTISPECIES: AcvB/VirJ family lysyl-phosphatidylglycerol hydrolase [unclassified Caulobacter]|uniref:AcvB/VirJ family lysyl-phosphatidylglycerol hydrolase n=1 Tax=unclassified Caulobacter TaxID=2648921 RepID=UPI0007821FA0|nr:MULTISPECIES: AcvB/VirJ family lysyl-phosphatidylglycerol hydrolase [unclassified Caulobacter]AZS22857.1 virulence factor [Caulobacter sp. FWC26]
MTSRIRLFAALTVLALAAGAALSAPARDHQIPIASAKPGDTLAVLYSGDGGWGPLDQVVARHLADGGVPTIGFNSLTYFRTNRSPDGVAGDLAGAVRKYEALWGRKNVVLIGYSFGADALPAIIPRLPSDVRARISHVVLIGTGPVGDLRFHPLSWLNLAPRDSFAVAPAIAALKDVKITCIYGDKERHDICPTLTDAQVAKIRLPGGHHFDGDYARLGEAVLTASRSADQSSSTRLEPARTP